MKKENETAKICFMIREKALANLDRLYMGMGTDEAIANTKAISKNFIESMTDPAAVAAFCKRENITRERFKWLLLVAPFMFTQEDAMEVKNALD